MSKSNDDMRAMFDRQNEIVDMSRSSIDPLEKEILNQAFFSEAIDFWNEHMTGDINLADGTTVHVPAIEN